MYEYAWPASLLRFPGGGYQGKNAPVPASLAGHGCLEPIPVPINTVGPYEDRFLPLRECSELPQLLLYFSSVFSL
jgi:hypothetical protein